MSVLAPENMKNLFTGEFFLKFMVLIDRWKDFKSIRSLIEDFNKFMKNGVGYVKIPVFTYKSAAKNTFLSVLLAGLIVSKLTPDNKTLQRLAEM